MYLTLISVSPDDVRQCMDITYLEITILLHWHAQQIPDAKHFGTVLKMGLDTYARRQTQAGVTMIGSYVKSIQVS